MLVGLCGRSGSGKGYIAALFHDRGIPSVDTDAVYRKMTAPAETLSPCMQDLTAYFGDRICTADNALDRGIMRSLVFGEGNAENLAALNRITHTHILKETKQIAEKYLAEGAPFVLIDAPVLYESGFDKYCAAVVCVTAPEEVLLARIMKRDGITKEAAQRRLASQMEKDKLMDLADFVIENNADRETLYARVDAVIDALCRGREMS